ncbi:MAG: potassium channel family protein [Nanoarchaeota archaeon]|nr:potassium channel family protein [Nanoarchaeota archaeon]
MKEHRNLLISVLVFFALLFAGACFYHSIEGWRWLDSIYFASMTATTVGYGDFIPKTDVGKMFTIPFSFLGIAFVFYFISVIGSILFKRHVSKHLKKDLRRR